MKFTVQLESTADGDYLAVCDDPLARCLGSSPANALDALRAELRYQLEMCPCSGIDVNMIELEVGS